MGTINYKKTISAILLVAIMLSSFLAVSAQEQITSEKIKEDYPNIDEVNEAESDFNLLSWFKKTFSIGEQFSVVGDTRIGCDNYPETTEKLIGNDKISSSRDYIEDECSSGEGLINVFDSNWGPLFEISSEEDVIVEVRNSNQAIFLNTDFSGTSHIIDISNNEIWVETYCCPYDECRRDSECEDRVGPGSTCEEKDGDDDITYWGGDFSYCTADIYMTCWYQSGSTCDSNTYEGQTYCPDTFAGKTLYEDKSECLNNLVECSSGDTQCEGYTYYTCSSGSWDNQGLVDGKCNYIEQDSKRCYNNDVYWYDSRNNKQNLYENCDYGCENGFCSEPDCNTEYDLNCDTVLERIELQNAVNDWKSNSISRTKLGEIINAWSN